MKYENQEYGHQNKNQGAKQHGRQNDCANISLEIGFHSRFPQVHIHIFKQGQESGYFSSNKLVSKNLGLRCTQFNTLS
jgi:hypothetical protein